jgi:putative flippase GtrA
MTRLHEIGRFLVVGALNTAGSLALFVGLATAMDPRLAYALAFAAGIAFTTVMSSSFVFRTQPRARSKGIFVVWYLVVFALGEGVVHGVAVSAGYAPWVAGLGTAAVTAPLNYIGGRITLVSQDKSRSA